MICTMIVPVRMVVLERREKSAIAWEGAEERAGMEGGVREETVDQWFV